jgi:hypothetical protein
MEPTTSKKFLAIFSVISFVIMHHKYLIKNQAVAANTAH